MIDFTVNSWIKIEHFSFWYHVTVEMPFLITFVIRIIVFVKKREKLISIILYIYAAVDSCSATFYYWKLSVYNWAKVGTVYSKMGSAVSRGIPRICRCELRNLANGAAEFGKNFPRKTVGPSHGSLNVNVNSIIRYSAYEFPLALHRNYSLILYHFGDNW